MTDRELMQQALDAMLNFPNDISDEMFESIRSLRARLAVWERVNMHDHKEGDLGIGTKPYTAQAAMVASQTQGRMSIDPVTGDVGIGTVKWDASAPLVMHPHPAFQATQPQPDLAKVGEVGVWGERQWQGLTDEEMMMIYGQNHEGKKYSFGRAIEAKLKEKNT